MARLAGVDIPNEKRIEIALTYIFGVGRTRAKETLAATGINPDIRVILPTKHLTWKTAAAGFGSATAALKPRSPSPRRTA